MTENDTQDNIKSFIVQNMHEVLLPLPSDTGLVMLTSDLTLVAVEDISEGTLLTAIPCTLKKKICILLPLKKKMTEISLSCLKLPIPLSL